MWHNFDDEGKWTAEIDNDELGAWLRLLKYASKCFKRGTVQIDGGIPYSPEQLKVMIRTDKEYIKKWALQGAITIKNGIISIENWESYQCEQDRKDKSSFKQTLKQTPLTDTLTDSTDLDLDLDLDIDLDKEKKKKKTKTNTSAPVKNPVAIWCEKFKAKFGEQYIATPKDAGHLNRVYKLIPEQFESKIDTFFEVDNFAHEWNVSIFQATLNKTKKQEPQIKYGKDY